MPDAGATTLEDLDAAGLDRLRIECERCGRSGSYSMERASILFGDRARLPFILATVTAACAERQKHGGRCWAVFKGLPGQKVG